MDQTFNPGDDLIFQLESGFGLLRVLAVEQKGPDRIWHLMAYEELFPDVEAAERALTQPEYLHVRTAHMALTGRGFDRVIKVARTVADLEAAERVSRTHVAEALSYRSAFEGDDGLARAG